MQPSPLLIAVSRGDKDTLINFSKHQENIKYLIERDNLLHVACRYGHKDIVKELITLGALSEARHPGNSRIPLHDACSFGNVEIVELIANLSGKHIDSQDKSGLTAAHICAMEGEVESLKILRDHGANFSIKDNAGMQLAHWAAKRNHPAVIRYLFDLDVDLDETCYHGRTAVHYAAMNKSLQALECLRKCRADVTIQDDVGAFAIHLAAKHDAVECLRFLVSQNVSPNVRQMDLKSPAHVAALFGSHECLHWLLNNGTDITSVDDEGNTIGHLACQSGVPEVIYCYLNHKGPVDILNKFQEDLLQISRRFGHPLKLETAKNGEVVCPLCLLESNKRNWDQIHALPSVVKTISNSQKSLFQNPLGRYENVVKKHRKQFVELKKEENKKFLETVSLGKETNVKVLMKGAGAFPTELGYRDLVTRYYGDFVHNH